ncbi:hypothetical protein [Sphingobacterium kyonggiense]
MFKYELNFENEKSLKDGIQNLAEKIAFNSILEINDNKYRITDFEFYINSFSAELEDPHTYNHNLQRETGKLYDHKSGLDITYGNGKNAIGILIRGIAKLETNNKDLSNRYFISTYFDGPHKSRTELIGNLRFNENNYLGFTEASTEMEASLKQANPKLISTQRVNLTSKITDLEGKYIYEPLRYVVLIPKYFRNDNRKLISNGNPMKIHGIEKIIKNALSDNIIDIDTAELILGYSLK